jgi:hypothetical protein
MSKKMEALTLQVPGYQHQPSKTISQRATKQNSSSVGSTTTTTTTSKAASKLVKDKYSILDGSFPREETSFEASKILQDIRLKLV